SYVGAAMVELLHTATLIHDDVVDEAKERRGIASINARWNNKIAVLIGDYLLAKGLLIAVENKEYGFLESLSRTVKRMSEGELLQIQKSKDYHIDEKTYYQIISNKTASLISTCCEIGAIATTNDVSIQQKMREFGELVGISFQIRDDIFDYSSKSSILGKPVGNDLKEKKITLPLIHSLSKVNGSEAKEIIKLIKEKKITKREISKVIDFVKANGGIEYAETRAREYIEKAQQILETFPDSPAKKSLQNLSIFVFERDI
ncbi:MAG: polyprenyl synthetase family protein, partial [Candidatus Kapabacteria bacterium]|nr:polyprenyl synthetase family protein [Candidatus Kapabacteria bacterium]